MEIRTPDVVPVGKCFHIEIRFLGTALSFRSGMNENRPSSLAWTPKCHSQHPVSIEVSSEVQITSLCTNLYGPSEYGSFHKLGSHRHALLGLNTVGPIFKIQDISHKNLVSFEKAEIWQCWNLIPV